MSDTPNAPAGLADTPLRAARLFHEAYERLAPRYGYTTREDTKAWNPLSPNGQLMQAVCMEVLGPLWLRHQRALPEGWKPVPIEPTLAMQAAYRGAMKDYIDRLPRENRTNRNGRPLGLSTDLKLTLRWRAMLAAAPEAPK